MVSIAGTHGVEGFVGSAIHCGILNSIDEIPDDCGVALVHCLNPWGMAMIRRPNEQNVDLNRNAVFAPHERDGAPEGYELIRSLLLPDKKPLLPMFVLMAMKKGIQHGFPAILQAITGGQYIDPLGLFYGGLELQQELRIFSSWLEANIKATDQILSLDLHSGLGRFCSDALLLDDSEGSEAHKRFVTLFPGEDVQAPDSSRSITYVTRGSLGYLLPQLFPDAVIDQAVQEFGTLNGLRVLYGLISDNYRFFNEPNKRSPRRLLSVFCPELPKWRLYAVRRGVEVFFHGLKALSNRGN